MSNLQKKDILSSVVQGILVLMWLKKWGKETDYEITVIDNLLTGRKDALLYGDLIVEDLENITEVERLFKQKHFYSVLHFAASVVAPESLKDPLKYYSNNTINSINLIRLAAKHKVQSYIFSSTAAV